MWEDKLRKMGVAPFPEVEEAPDYTYQNNQVNYGQTFDSNGYQPNLSQSGIPQDDGTTEQSEKPVASKLSQKVYLD
jgi:hypothetical protein